MSGDEIMSADEIDNAWQSSPDDVDWPQVLRSHEALRAERDVVQSIAERYMGGWEEDRTSPRHDRWRWLRLRRRGGGGFDEEPMTPEQVEWFRAREDRR